MGTPRTEDRLQWAGLAAGVAAGLAALWVLGGAFVLTGEMGGYGWPGYVLNGWLAEQGLHTRIDTLRAPLHPTLLGALGEWLGSYANAGIVISSASAGLAVVAAGVGAAALSGGWAGGLAALCAGIALGIHGAPAAVNQYPFLAGLTVAAVGGSALAARLPGGWTGAAAGLFVGLAVAGESRGVLLVPAAAVLVLVGLVRAERWAKARLVVGFGLTLAAGLALKTHLSDLQHANMIGEAATASGRRVVQLDQQREVVARWVTLDADLRGPCAPLAHADYLTADYLSTDCARAVLTENLTVRIPRHLPLGAAVTLAGAVLLLLPVRDRRGAWAAGLAAGVLAGSSVLALAVLTPMPGRYVIQQAPLLAMIGAAGAGRLFGWLPRPLPGVAMVLLAGWVVTGGWDGRSRADRPPLSDAYATYADAAATVDGLLTEGDAFIDCADLHVELALLPRRFRSADLSRDVPLADCTAWVSRTAPSDGTAYILARPNRRLRGQVDIAAAVEADGRWTRVAGGGAWGVWRLE